MATQTPMKTRFRFLLLRRGDRFAGAVILATFLTFLLASARLETGTLNQPGPGLWPQAISIIGIGLSLHITVFGYDVPILGKKGTLRDVLVITANLLLLPYVYLVAGFIVSAALSILVMVKFVGRHGWLTSVATAVLGSVLIYLLFAQGLGLSLSAF